MVSHQLDVLRVPGSIPGGTNFLINFFFPPTTSAPVLWQKNSGEDWAWALRVAKLSIRLTRSTSASRCLPTLCAFMWVLLTLFSAR